MTGGGHSSYAENAGGGLPGIVSNKDISLAPIAISTGALLCVVGAVFFALSHAPTSLIPLFLGFLIAVCGVLARKESMRKHAMHGAVLIALFGIFGSFMGPKSPVPAWTGRAPMGEGPTEKLLLLVICLVFVVLSVRSFVAARKATSAS